MSTIEASNALPSAPVLSPANPVPNNSPAVNDSPAVDASTSAMVLTPKQLQAQAHQLNLVVNSIISLVDGREFTPAMIVRMVANCMSITAAMKLGPAVEKQIISKAIEKFVRDYAGLGEGEVDSVMAVVEVIVNGAIDTLVDVRAGSVKLGEKKGCCMIM